MPKKHAGGRPKQGQAVKQAPLNMRTDPELRRKIELAADENGESLTQEVERRLRTSFIFEDHLGGPHIFTFVNLLASTIAMIEQKTGKKWTENVETWHSAEAAARRLFRWSRPASKDEQKTHALFVDELAASEAHEAALKALDDFRNSLGLNSSRGFVLDGPKLQRGRGLFGAGPSVAWVDPRADWTDEQKQEEARLLEEERRASDDAAALVAKIRKIIEPRMERMQEAADFGESLAEAQFQQLGPKAKRPKTKLGAA